MRRNPYNKSYEERYEELKNKSLAQIDKNREVNLSSKIGSNSSAQSAATTAYRNNPNDIKNVSMDDYEGRYNYLIEKGLKQIDTNRALSSRKPVENKPVNTDPTTAPTVKLSDLNKEQNPQKSTFGSAAKAIGGSFGAGIMNTLRNVGNLSEQSSYELYGDDPYSQKNKLSEAETKQDKLDVLTGKNELFRGKDVLAGKKDEPYNPSASASNKLIKPIEDKLDKWASVEDENRVVRWFSGAAKSIPQSLMTRALPVVGVPMIFNNAYQNLRDEFEAEGMDLNDPMVQVRLAGSAAVETASEYFFNLFSGIGGTAANAGGKTAARSIFKPSSQKLVKPTWFNFAKHIGLKGAEEGAEEMVSEAGQAAIAILTTDRGRKLFTKGIEYETDQENGSIRFDDIGNLIVDDNDNPIMFDENDQPIETTGAMTLTSLIDSFASGAIAGSALSTAADISKFTKTREFTKKYLDTKDISKITEEDLKNISDALRADLKANPDIQEQVEDALSSQFQNAMLSSVEGTQYTEASTGDVVTMHYDSESKSLFFDTALGQTTLTPDQFDQAIETGMFKPVETADGSQPDNMSAQTMPDSAAVPAAMPVQDQGGMKLPLEAMADSEATQTAPEGMPQTDAPVNKTPEAGKAIQNNEGGYTFATNDGRAFDITETLNASGTDTNIYTTTTTNAEGKQAKITAKYSAKSDEVTLTVEADGGIKDKAFTVTLNRLDYEQADNKMLFINNSSDNRLGRKFIGFGNDISLYNGVGAVVDLAFNNSSQTLPADMSDQIDQEQGTEADSEIEDTSKELKEANAIAKDKASFNIAEAAIEKFNGIREAIRNTQDKYMEPDIMKAIRSVDSEFDAMGVVGFVNPLREADLTRKQKKIRDIIQESIGKEIIYVKTHGAIEMDEFVSDWAKNTIFVNVEGKSEQNILWSVGHGMYHILKQNGNGSEFEAVAKKYLPKDWQDSYLLRFENLEGYADKLGDEGLLEEAIADRAGAVFTQAKFWDDLSKRMSANKKTGTIAKLKKFLEKFTENKETKADEINTMISILDNYDSSSKNLSNKTSENTVQTEAKQQEDKPPVVDSETKKKPIDMTYMNNVKDESRVIHKEFGGVKKRIIATANLIHPSGVRDTLYITKFFKNGFSALSSRQTSAHENRLYYNPSTNVFREFSGDLNFVAPTSIEHVNDMFDDTTVDTTSAVEKIRNKYQKAYQEGKFKYYALVKLEGEDGYHVITTDDSASKQEFRDDLRGNGYTIMNNVIGDKADYHMVTVNGKHRTVSAAKKELAALRKIQKGSDDPKIWDSDIANLENNIKEAESFRDNGTATVEDAQPKTRAEILGEFATGKDINTKIVPNKYIQITPVLLSADQLMASNDSDGNPTEGYNPIYQPRGRDRAAAIRQIQDIVQKPDFLEMMRTGDVSSGMTTFNPDDMNVLSGNGRMAAIKRIYAEGGAKAKKLEASMLEMAQNLGIDTRSMPLHPVVSGAIPEGTDGAQFAQDSNPTVGLQYSPAENAKLDSRNLSPEIVILYNDSDLNNRSNHDFVANFLKPYSKEELALFQDEKGFLSQQGKQRISNAILYKAFPSNRLINLISESTDNNVKNTTNALMNVSGLIVSVRDQIDKGMYHDLDISQELTSAFEKYIEISKAPKVKGYDSAIDAYFAQVTMDFMNMTPIEEKLIKIFYGFKNSRPKLVGFLKDYYEGITKLSSPNEVSLFGDNFAPDRDAYIDNAFLKVLGEGGAIYEKENGTQENPNHLPLDEFFSRAEENTADARKSQPKFSIGQSITERAIEEFGTTYNKYEAGYILPDGRMLDFSGKKLGGPPNNRAMDHRDVNTLYDSDSYDTNSDAMMKFVKDTSAVRVSFHKNYSLIDITSDHPLTDKQKALLRRHAAGTESLTVDFYSEYFKDERTKSWELEMPRITDISRVLDEVDQMLESVEKIKVPADRVVELWQEDIGREFTPEEKKEAMQNAAETAQSFIDTKEALSGTNHYSIRAGLRKDTTSTDINPAMRGGIRNLFAPLYGFKKTWKNLDFVGLPANNYNEFAAAAIIARDPKIEHNHIYYVKDGKIILHEGWTCNLPDAASALPMIARGTDYYGRSNEYIMDMKNQQLKQYKRVIDRINKLGADGIFVSHNHPSGYPDPSKDDLHVSKNFTEKFGDNYLGMVIVDHNKATFINPVSDSSYEKYDINFKSKDAGFTKTDVYSHKNLPDIRNLGLTPFNAQAIVDKAASTIPTERISKNHTTFIYTEAQGKITGIQTIPNGMFTGYNESKKDNFQGFIMNQKSLFGGNRVFAVGNGFDGFASSNIIHSLISKQIIEDYIILKFGHSIDDYDNKEVETSFREKYTYDFDQEIDARGIESVMNFDNQIMPQLPNRPAPVNNERIPETGQYPAVETDDGQVFWDVDGKVHVQIANKFNIPAERIRSGGWLIDGVYEPTEQSSITKWSEMEKAKQKVELNRYKKNLEANKGVKFSLQGEHAWSMKNVNSAYYNKPVLDLITDAIRYYDIKTNAATIENATAMLRADRDQAITNAMDMSKASAELTVIRMAMTFKAQSTGDYDGAANWVYITNKAAKNSAQAVQAHNIFHKMDPNSIIPFAAKEIASFRNKKDQDIVDQQTKQVKDLMKLADLNALNKALEDMKAINEALKKDNVSLKDKLAAAKKLEDRLNQNKGRNLIDDIVSDPVGDFVEMLHGVLSTMVPFNEMPKTSDPVTFMQWFLKNKNKYTDVWNEALDMFNRLHENDGLGRAEVMTYFGDLMPDGANANKQISMFDQDMINKIGATLKNEYQQTYHTFQSMVKRLLDLGVSDRDAINLTRHFQKAIADLSTEEKIRTLRKVLPNKNASVTEKFLHKLVNISNERGLGDGEVNAYIAKMAGLPSLTPDIADEIMHLANQRADINEAAAREGRKLTPDEERQVHILSATILSLIMKQRPVHWTQKVDTIQSMMMLSMFKSAGRNIIGNTFFGTMDSFKDYISVGVDRLLSAYTGQKTVPMPQLGAFMKGAKRGAMESAYDIHHDIETSDINAAYALYRGEVFKSKLGKMAMKVFRYKMVLPDRIMQIGFYESYLNGLMKMNGVTEATADMQEAALLHAQIKTFADDNVISDVFSKGRTILNNMYNKEGLRDSKKAYQWGLGSMLIKFPRVPGALLARSLEYSPLNLARALSYLVKAKQESSKFNTPFKDHFAQNYQKKFAVQLTNSTFGTAISIGLGLFLANAGVLFGRREEDKKKRDVLATTGIHENQINWSGLFRFIASGFDPEAAKLQEGDSLATYEWLAPMSLGMAIGANIYQETKTLQKIDMPLVEKAMQTILVAGMSGMESITEMSLMRGVADFMDNTGYRSSISSADRQEPYFGERIINTAVSVPASFVPNELRVIKEFLNNTRRSNYSTNPLEYSYRLILNKLPFAAQTLPESRDVFGNLKEVYSDNGNNIWNVFFNPAFVNKYKPSPEAMIVLNTMAEQEGTILEGKNVAPRTVDRKIPATVNGEKVELVLDDYERSEMQRLVGQNVKEYFKQIPADLPLEQKVEAMYQILNETSAVVKEHMAKKKLGLD